MSTPDESTKPETGDAPPLAELENEHTDALAPAIHAMDRGNVREARMLATQLVENADPDVRKRARALVDQTEPDRVIVAVLIGTALLICILVTVFVASH